MSSGPDRIVALEAQSRVSGIDFVFVHPSQTVLDVYFLRDVATLDTPLPGSLAAEDIRIYSPASELPEVNVSGLTWPVVDGETVLRITTIIPGDFALYRIHIDDLRIDPFYNDVSFSFKANCPSDADCAPLPHECPPEDLVDFAVDYSARDFWSFRRALLDFASLRYPDWNDRLEADAGIMFAELLSALGDEMAYYQDRVAREAYIETATQRRSLRQHARLVDYEMYDGVGALVWMDITTAAGNHDIPAGTGVYARGEKGGAIHFEIGKGIAETSSGLQYNVDGSRNEFLPYLWDEDDTCLRVGATSVHLQGHHKAHLPFDDFSTDAGTGKVIPGKWVLLKTQPANPAQAARSHLVRVVEVDNQTDPVLNLPITCIKWEEEQALPFEMDKTVLVVRGNIVPATSGKTFTQYFVANRDDDKLTAPQIAALNNLQADNTIQREGHDSTLNYLYSLPGSQTEPLVYHGAGPSPEVLLQPMQFSAGSWVPGGSFYTAKKSFVGLNASGAQDDHFVLDDGYWKRLVGYQRLGEEFVHRDYDSNEGVTIRFGDGEFGRTPDENTVFELKYRLGALRLSNVSADTVKHLTTTLPFVQNLTNPLPAINGRDAETAIEMRQVVADAFREITYRAVRPEDYAEAAGRLGWVQKAGAEFRYTGSWLSNFVTADPKGKTSLSVLEERALGEQMNRFRQAGREVIIQQPEYANIDLDIALCIQPFAYAADVKKAVTEALFGRRSLQPTIGYFSPDRFTFGTPLERSTLEAAIQNVSGVKAVERIRFRRRGWFNWQNFTTYSYHAGSKVIIRIENNPLLPEQGKIKLHTHGGL